MLGFQGTRRASCTSCPMLCPGRSRQCSLTLRAIARQPSPSSYLSLLLFVRRPPFLPLSLSRTVRARNWIRTRTRGSDFYAIARLATGSWHLHLCRVLTPYKTLKARKSKLDIQTFQKRDESLLQISAKFHLANAFTDWQLFTAHKLHNFVASIYLSLAWLCV